MIVTCERCATQFQLDDARVPDGGVRVRCSRCKHAFFVEVPAKNEMERIHRVARRALEEAEEGPGVTNDLPESPESPPPAPERNELASDDEESDWEFNDLGPAGADLGAPEPGESEEAASSDFESSGLELGSSGLELDDDDESPFDLAGTSDVAPEEASAPSIDTRPAPAEEPAPSAPALDESPLDVAPPAPDPAPPAPQPAAPVPQPAAPAPQPSLAPAETGGQAADGDELGSPGDWDIFDDVAPPEPTPALTEAPAPRLAEPLPEVPAEALEDDAAVARWPRWVGSAVGWGATLALCGVGLVTGLAPRAPGAAVATPTEVSGLQPDQVEAAWVDNAVYGRIYVVSGALRNAGTTAVSSGPIGLVLRDAAGRNVDEPAALVAPIPERLLREADREAVRADVALSGGPLYPKLAPGQHVRFQAVVWELPAAAERFAFEPLAVETRAPAPVEPDLDSSRPEALSSGALPPSPPPSEE